MYWSLHSKSNGCCYYCGVELNTESCTVDHVLPKFHGGDDSIDNLVLACKSCNSSKREIDAEDFRLRLAFRLCGCPHKFSVEQIKWMLKSLDRSFCISVYSFVFFGEKIEFNGGLE